MQKGLIVTDTTRFLLIKNIDKILSSRKLTKGQIIDRLANLRDELDRFD